MMAFDCAECGTSVHPVWAYYEASAPIAGASASGRFRLPMHRCPVGHLHGWRPGEDFFFDLADSADFDFGSELSGGTVQPQRRLFRSTRCGNCSRDLELRETGERLRGTLTVHIRAATDPATFELDLPEVVCATCGARPAPDHKGIRDTKADILSWIFQLIAEAMPPERATRLEDRA